MATIILSSQTIKELKELKEKVEIENYKRQCNKSGNMYSTPFGYSVVEKDLTKAFQQGFDGIENI